MPFDTEAKRKAAAGIPFIPEPALPDGEISEADMHTMAGVYVPGAGDFDYDDKLTHITVEGGKVTDAVYNPYAGVLLWGGIGQR